jgi:hypothetical protein
MQANGLRYVLYTPNEAALGPFSPAASNEFEQIFARPEAILFRPAGSG